MERGRLARAFLFFREYSPVYPPYRLRRALLTRTPRRVSRSWIRQTFGAAYLHFCVLFEWDEEKGRANQRKHGVSFEEAETVFGDPLHQTLLDRSHSEDEYRLLTTGYTSQARLVVVAHTDRGDFVRIITARQALPRERRKYEQRTRPS
jgi:uncharacterized DUF497 family protein